MVNVIVLLRLNIRLYIEGKDREIDILNALPDDKKDVVTIRIKTLDKRMRILYYSYFADGLIFLFNVFFLKNGIESSICLLILIPIVITLYNNLVDVAKRKYNVDEEVVYESGKLEGVDLHDNIGN